MRQRVLAGVTATLLVSTVSGCGGGGGGGPTAVTAQPPPVTRPGPRVTRLPFPLREWRCRYSHIAGACGIDGPIDRPHFGIRDLPDQSEEDARHSPVYHDHDGRERRVLVGVDQGTEHVGGLPHALYRGDAQIRFGTLRDGAGRDEVVAYLSQVAPSGSTPSSDRVRVIGASSQRDRNRVAAAVRLVNAALPEDAKLVLDPALPDLSLRGAIRGRSYWVSGRERADTIHVEFVPARASASGHGAASTWEAGDHSYVQFYTGSNSYRDDRQSVILLAHEIMHSLGLRGHVSPSFRTIFEGTSDIHAASQGGLAQPMSLLYPVDREALRALYGRLRGRGGPSALGPWSDTSLHVHGNAPHAGFGVALRNGYAEPWAYGYLPDRDLGAGGALSGTVTWSGELVGLTPDAEAVLGDAAIRVDVSALTGTAAFTGLERWAARQAPGAAGTGTTWGDGDLRYSIAVRGNTFRETGGDDGRLTGVLTGRAHEGVAGTLERADLTAAFGGSRE